MELLFLLLSLILPIFTLLIFFPYKPNSGSKTNLPPGSFGWPFIGETLEFLFGKPDKFVGDRMKKYNPKIFKTMILGEPTVVFCGVSGNKFLAANEEKLFRGWRPHSMQKLFRSTYQTVTSDSIPRETEVQVFRAPGFLRPEALVRYLGKMETMTQEHLNMHWDGKRKVEVYSLIQLLTATMSSRFFLGLEDHNRIAKLSKLLDGMSIGLHSIPVNIPGTIFYNAKKGADAIRKEILLIIKEKKAAMSSGIEMHDILSHMIVNSGATAGRFMPENEIADKVMGLLVAGFSTPATAITFLLKYIGERPDIYDKILSEQLEIASSKNSNEALNWDDLQKMKYSWNVAVEVMRLVPPFQGTFREAITDFTYDGFTIPKGWKIYWAISSTNKNPEHFPDPEKFDPTRYEKGNVPPPYSNVPFGGGPRICPGKEYARLLLLTFLHSVVKRFKWEIMLPNEKIIGSMIPTPAQGLPVRLQPRFA